MPTSPDELRKREMQRIIDEVTKGKSRKDALADIESTLEAGSREYKRFKAEETEEDLTIYERLCKVAAKLGLKPDSHEYQKLQTAISFAHLRITPEGSYSLAIVSSMAFLLLSGLAFLLKFVDLSAGLILMAASLGFLLYMNNYPKSLASRFRIQASSEIILAIIYMVIYMRSSPNLEGAVRFAAINLTGPLAYDFRKMLWDVETRKYESMEAALVAYLDKWRENEEFIESIHLIRNSMQLPESKRHNALDEAVNVILTGTKDKMAHYSQGLRMPITLIHMMGIILPMLVLVMFPLIILFLRQTINPLILIFFYDVALPIFIYFVGVQTLEKRPLGFAVPDISLHPKYAPLGKMQVGANLYSIWPVGAAVGGAITLLGLYLFFQNPRDFGIGAVVNTLTVIWGIGLGFAIFYIMDSRKKMRIREDIKRMQNEFAEALFRLGNAMALGTPLERAMDDVVIKSPELAISKLFRNTLNNVQQGRLSFESALFDKEYGAIWDYPSKLIINVMRIILEATKKGVKIAGSSALAISRYIKQLVQIEEYLKEILSESTSSMKFLALFLGPLIAGITVTMAGVMMQVFNQLGRSLEALESAQVPGFSQLLIGGWGEAAASLPIGMFQLVVGIYVLEVTWLLSMLANGVENGPGDKIAQRNLTGWSLLVSLVVYSLSLLVSYLIFGSAIEGLLIGGNV